MTRSIIPFGPQHPVLPEPIHLDLVIEDEKVIEAIPSIGFIHRGLEKLVEKKDYKEYVHVADRVCGICSFIHGMTYCMAIEEIIKTEIPPRAKGLRVIWSELSRIHSHLLWLGLMADAFGFESLFMQSWRIREKFLDIIEESTGGRVIFGAAKIGGVRKDIANDKLKDIVRKIKDYEKDIRSISGVFIDDYTVKKRLCGIGVIGMKEAYQLGTVGPTLRASGISFDIRSNGYALYDKLSFEAITEKDGDSHARCKVRIREIFQSLELIREAAEKLADSPVDIPVKDFPSGECFMRAEQPRGEVVYYVKANGTKFLDRLRLRTPTFANIPALVKILRGIQLSDVPIVILTIDPCISCTER